MATQIFIEPELENLDQPEVAAEWFEICSELGLDKQISFADRSEEKKAPPYMFIDPKSARIIRTLCPCGVDYTMYDASTIPLDVLQEIQKCEKNGWYNEIRVFYDNKSPDPFVVGYLPNESAWNRQMHLIARWGAELIPFEQLEAKAIARLKDEATKALSMAKMQVDYALQNVEAFINGVLAGDEIPQVRFTTNDLRSWGSSSNLPF